MGSPFENGGSVAGSRCKLPLLLGLVLLAILAFQGFRPLAPEIEKRSDSQSVLADLPPHTEVSIRLDFGDGRQLDFSAVPWRRGMTIADLLHEIHGISIVQKGTGKAAFLVGINGIENEGADGKNWLYEVNGQSGDRSFADYELRPGDRVLWTFRASR